MIQATDLRWIQFKRPCATCLSLNPITRSPPCPLTHLLSNTESPLASKHAPADRRAEAPHDELLLGGGFPAVTVAFGAILGARASPEAELTVVEGLPTHPHVAGLPSSVSFTISLQNEFLLSPRTCRKKPHRFSCPIPQVRDLPSFSHGISPPLFSPASWR
jgi:hypothetical protein